MYTNQCKSYWAFSNSNLRWLFPSFKKTYSRPGNIMKHFWLKSQKTLLMFVLFTFCSFSEWWTVDSQQWWTSLPSTHQDVHPQLIHQSSIYGEHSARGRWLGATLDISDEDSELIILSKISETYCIHFYCKVHYPDRILSWNIYTHSFTHSTQ